MRRRWLLILASVLGLFVLTAATLPYWLGGLLPLVARRFGADYGAYERLGYGRFALRDVVVRRGAVTIEARHVQADTPLLWSWRHLRGTGNPVTIGEWSVDVKSQPPRPRTQPTGWMPLRASLRRISVSLDRWLPQASTGSGVVRWPRGEIRVQGVRWQEHTLTAQGLRYRDFVADAQFQFHAGDVMTLTAANPTVPASLDLKSVGSQTDGRLTWWGQQLALNLRSDAQGWMPPEASVVADDLRLPGVRVKLEQYATVGGTVRVDWRVDHFITEVNLRAEPRPQHAVPPLQLVLHGNGNAQAITVAALRAVLPGVTAELSEPVTVERSGRIRESGARFVFQADLARQPWVSAQGRLAGSARVTTGTDRTPSVEFQLSANDLIVADTPIAAIQGSGRLTWPALNVEHLEIKGPAGDLVRADGGWDFRAREVLATRVSGELKRETLGRWLSPSVQFSQARIEASVRGKAEDLQHRGRLEFSGLRVGRLNPLAGQVDWRGEARRVDAFTIAVGPAEARLTAAGSATMDEVRLSDLSLWISDKRELQLAAPARVAWRPGWAVDELRMTGPQASVFARLSGRETGRVELAVRGIRSTWLTRFVPIGGPAWVVTSVALTGSWDRGPLGYTLAGGFNFDLPQQRTATINLAAQGGADGLRVDALHAEESGHAVVNASGRIPLTLRPGARPLVGVDVDGPLVVKATTVPNAAFWQQLASLTGVELSAPEIAADLAGSWRRPRGNVTFRARRATMDPKRFARALPTIEAVDVALAADGDGIQLERFAFAIEGQAVRASGRLPVPRRAWGELAKDPLTYLREGAEARVEVPEAKVAMFSRFLPAALAPVGRLQADIRFDRGALGGYLRLRDAASRPLGPLGVLQQLTADVDFSDQKVNLRKVTATAGGQPVVLTGTVVLPTLVGGGPRSMPQYDVALRGTNLPFVRRSGLLLRGDVDLSLRSPPGGPPVIGGSVTLRDSLFLADIRAYLPQGGGASPARRPPYFSVDVPPLNQWQLDVQATGTRFIRIRMPVFAGTASMRFHLGGTLGEPRAIGDVTLEDGQVMMPFATFTVRQGVVRLTEESPYEPIVFLRGAGRHWGYDLTMEITGKASQPNIQFSSSPALDSEQVLLMVMTGAAPSNEVTTSLRQRAVQIGAFFGQSILGSLTGGGARPDRLSIETGAKISRQGKETYQIEYELNDRWTVTGEYDEFDEYNVGFKWRVKPRKTE